MKRRRDKKLMEQYLGKNIPKKAWEMYEPDQEEDLRSATTALPPRLKEREYEIAGAVGAYENVAGIAESEEIQKLVRLIREKLFGTETVPFISPKAAVQWIAI